jgi:hypothetical protein
VHTMPDDRVDTTQVGIVVPWQGRPLRHRRMFFDGRAALDLADRQVDGQPPPDRIEPPSAATGRRTSRRANR